MRICRLAFATILLSLPATGHAQASEAPCPSQPLPAAIDSAGPWQVNDFTKAIEFSATPSLQFPGRPWVVRLHAGHAGGPGQLDILQLRRETKCNRYEVEKRWQADLPASEFAALLETVAPFATPAADTFTTNDPWRSMDAVGIDGTGLRLRLQTGGWRVNRTIHRSSRPGAAVSAIFHDLVRKHVPAHELPSDEWRMPRAQ